MGAETLSANQAAPRKKAKRQSAFAIFWRRFRKQKAAMFCLILMAAVIFLCICAPLIAPYGYEEIDGKHMHESMSAAHIFGTDDLGRDIFSRILYGGRYSIGIAFGATIISMVIGMVIGGISGFFGGSVDMVLMRILDIIQAIPGILLTIIVAVVLGTGPFKMMLALSIGGIPGYARMLRAQVLTIRNAEYVEAATAANCGSLRNILTHVIPNTLTPIIVSASMNIAGQILGCASLSYIGVGIQQPLPEWGAMLSGAKGYMRTYPYMLMFPGIMIMITVFCFNMIGDGVRDALDPKLKD